MEFFSGATTLKQLFPDRDIFHVSEFCNFCYTIGWYFAEIGNINQAKIHLQMIDDVMPEDACEMLEQFYSLQEKIAFQIVRRRD